jgi:GTP-binding protein
MSRALQFEFLQATPDAAALRATRAEIAFIGRSNVGKSSLLNALAGGKKLALVSSMPGRTQVLTCYSFDGGAATAVDCPGYGYASVAKKTRATWLPMVEQYLLGREHLEMVLLLVDGEIGPTASDLAMLEWLRGNGLPTTVVATKLDKVRPSRREARQRELAARCAIEPSGIVWVSADDGTGIPRLRELVRSWLA